MQAVDGSSVQSDDADNAEALHQHDASQQAGFMRQLSSSVDGSQSDMQSMLEQAAGPADHTQQAQATHHQGQLATGPARMDAWSQSESIPDIATTSGSMESGTDDQLLYVSSLQSVLTICFVCSDHASNEGGFAYCSLG